MEPEVLARFERGDARFEERGRVIRHLMSGCESCSDRLRPSATAPRQPEAGPSMSRILSQLAETRIRLDAERTAAEEAWKELQKHPAPRQWTLLRNSTRFDSLAFADRLLDSGFAVVLDDPHRTLELSQMALLVAERLDSSRYSRGAIDDLQGRSWSRIANAQRATSDLAAAEASLAKAGAKLQTGSGEPLAEAEFWYFTSALRRAQRRLDEALVAIRRSRRIYRMLRDRHLEGRSLLSQAIVHDLQGDLEKCIDCTRRALAQIDAERDPKLAFAGRHSFAWYLMCAGAADEALDQLEQLRPTYLANGDRMLLFRMHWLEGRIRRLRREPAESEASLRRALDGFSASGIPYEAASVGLDLAVLLAECGRTQELKPLAAELVAVFQGLGVAREACAALIVFETAARAEAVTLGFLAQLNDYLGRVRSQPGLVFTPTA
jgi:tetratricopeptide (TPR) repeat protein